MPPRRTAPPRTAPRRFARRLAWSVGLLALLAAAVEALARATTTYEDTVLSPQNARLVDHPTRFFTLRPGWRSPDPPPFTVNADGFRGPPLRPHPPGTHRVLLLGESTTMGAGVADGEEYARVLEGMLNGGAGGSGAWEVVNAGVGAWTIWQSSVFLAEEIDRLDPEVVVPYHQHNDFLATGVVDEHNFLYEVRLTDRELYERRLPFAPLLSLLYDSRAYLLLRKQVLLDSARELPRANDGPAGSGRRVPDPDRVAAWGAIVATCAAHGAKLLPTIPAYRVLYLQDHVIRDVARTHDLPLVDLDEARRAAHVSPDVFFLDDIHPTALGHRFIAARLYDAIQALGG